MNQEKVAIGIPFRASNKIDSLILCLASLKKYVSFKFDLFLLVDYTNDEIEQNFSIKNILEINNEIRIKYYKNNRGGLYKQCLIDWISNKNYDYFFIMHADIFLYKENVLEKMLSDLKNTDNMLVSWKTDLLEYKSTYHINEEKCMLIAPRICTWLFCVNNNIYKDYISNKNLDYPLFVGHYLFDLNEDNKYINWIKKQPNFDLIKGEHKNCFFDIGSFFRYLVDNSDAKMLSYGLEQNPSFASMDLCYRDFGFVHIEQYDPTRFNNKFYKEDLLEERTKIIKAILKEEFDINV